MKVKAEVAVGNRRNFLKFAGVGAVSAGGAVVGAAGVAAKTNDGASKPGDDLYRETEHVKRYYELAR